VKTNYYNITITNTLFTNTMHKINKVRKKLHYLFVIFLWWKKFKVVDKQKGNISIYTKPDIKFVHTYG